MIIHRITITRINRPPKEDVNAELQWLANSLGLFSARDKDMSCYRLFVELIKRKEGMTSDELAFHLNLTRGTVVHHLNRLMESGVVITNKNRYVLRVENLRLLIDVIEKELSESLQQMKRVAEALDKEIGLK